MYYIKLDNKLDRTIEKEIVFNMYQNIIANRFYDEIRIIDFMKKLKYQESNDIEKILENSDYLYLLDCIK